MRRAAEKRTTQWGELAMGLQGMAPDERCLKRRRGAQWGTDFKVVADNGDAGRLLGVNGGLVEGRGVRRRSSLLVSNGAARLHKSIGVARSGGKRGEKAMAVKMSNVIQAGAT